MPMGFRDDVVTAHGRGGVADLPAGTPSEKLTSTAGLPFVALRNPTPLAVDLMRRHGTLKGWVSLDGNDLMLWPGRFGTHFQVFGGLHEQGWQPFRSSQPDLVMGETAAAFPILITSPAIAAMFRGAYTAGGMVDDKGEMGWHDEVVVGAGLEPAAPRFR